MSNYNSLFTPMNIGKCQIKNRVVITAMEGTGIVENMFGPKFNPKCRDYYLNLAKNDVGLLIPGMLPVYSMMMGKWTHKAPKEFEKARGLIDEIHSYGSKVFFQIGAGFAGRNYTLVDKLIPVAENKVLKKVLNPIVHLNEMMVGPSDGTPMVWAPQLSTRGLTKEEIKAYIDGYAKTAKLCKDNGIDGVEVHAVHEGYLMDQFTTKYTNKRTDEYGGSFENRYRFAVEVVKAIKKECGDDYPVMLRYSVTSKVIDFNVGAVPGEEFKEKGRDMEESIKAAKYLTEAGYDALDCDNGTYDSWYWAHPPVYMPLNCNLNEAVEIKKHVDVPVICAGKMQADKASEAIASKQIDGVGIARQFLCDPEYLTKLKEGREAEIRP
ncbi:MAG: 2-enoate reductase, partial [Solobacterium sp.]|nr:2-enoate reductase [Solobacterium sp.]